MLEQYPPSFGSILFEPERVTHTIPSHHYAHPGNGPPFQEVCPTIASLEKGLFMKLQAKLNSLSLTVLLAMTILIVLAGLFTIEDIIVEMNRALAVSASLKRDSGNQVGSQRAQR